MEFKTISDTENPLFNRREIEGEIHTEVTPSRQAVAKLLSEKFSVPVKNIKIRTILGKFGSKVFIINANLYSSKEERDRIEIKKKKDAEVEKKAEEAAKVSEEPVSEEPAKNTSEQEAETTAEEVPVEEASEEKPAEPEAKTPTEKPKEEPVEKNKSEEMKDE